MVTESRMSKSPVTANSSKVNELGVFGMLSVIVPAGRLMTSAPEPAAQSGQVAASVLALIMASRMVQMPLLLRVSPKPLTLIVFACAGEVNAAAQAINARSARGRINFL